MKSQLQDRIIENRENKIKAGVLIIGKKDQQLEAKDVIIGSKDKQLQGQNIKTWIYKLIAGVSLASTGYLLLSK